MKKAGVARVTQGGSRRCGVTRRDLTLRVNHRMNRASAVAPGLAMTDMTQDQKLGAERRGDALRLSGI